MKKVEISACIRLVCRGGGGGGGVGPFINIDPTRGAGPHVIRDIRRLLGNKEMSSRAALFCRSSMHGAACPTWKSGWLDLIERVLRHRHKTFGQIRICVFSRAPTRSTVCYLRPHHQAFANVKNISSVVPIL